MSDNDPTELLLLCDAILEDGEISGDEAYNLAAWLNDHRESCMHWPGDLLVHLLQEIWADGKVTKTELRQLGRLLIRIRKESVKRQSEQAVEHALAETKLLLQNFDLSQPTLPLLPWTAAIKSHSEKGLVYQVDLNAPSCTCPDFQSKRRALPLGHPTRCCKHVFDAFRRFGSPDSCPGWLRAFIDSGWPPHPQTNWMVLSLSGKYVLASTAPTGWANVYASHGTRYDRYGYNIQEQRWSYGEEPEGATYIASVIHRACG